MQAERPRNDATPRACTAHAAHAAARRPMLLPPSATDAASASCLLVLVQGCVVLEGGVVEDVVGLALGQGALVGDDLDVRAVVDQAALLAEDLEVLAGQVGEAPVQVEEGEDRKTAIRDQAQEVRSWLPRGEKAGICSCYASIQLERPATASSHIRMRQNRAELLLHRSLLSMVVAAR